MNTLSDMNAEERFYLKCYKLRDIQKAKAHWKQRVAARVIAYKKYKLYNESGVHVEESIVITKKVEIFS